MRCGWRWKRKLKSGVIISDPKKRTSDVEILLGWRRWRCAGCRRTCGWRWRRKVKNEVRSSNLRRRGRDVKILFGKRFWWLKDVKLVDYNAAVEAIGSRGSG